jgi:hypothetical protein
MLSTLAQLLKMPINEFKQVVKKAMKTQQQSFRSCGWLLCAIKTVKNGSRRYADLVLKAENSRSWII